MTYQESLKPQLTPQQQAVLNKQHQQGGTINIFGGSNDQPVQHQHHQHPTQILQQQQQQQQQYQQESYVNRNRSQRSGFNPITGQDYATENVQQNQQPASHQYYQEPLQEQRFHSSSRVLQPPGGKSSNIW